jgi:hypothetical protein
MPFQLEPHVKFKLWGLFLFLLAPSILPAQVRLSEQASVQQVINGTRITLEFYRPVARGRDSLFGKVVRWNETWTPGANWATTIEADKDFRLNGHLIPKGKYSFWMIPAKDSAWTVFLNKNPRLYHVRRPKDTKDDVVRFKVAPRSGQVMEALMWYFPTIVRDSATLRMHWGTTMIDMSVKTAQMEQATLSEPQRRMYVGEWSMKYEGSRELEAIEILSDGDKLVIRPLKTSGDEAWEAELIPVGEHRFRHGEREKGAVVEVGDHPMSFVVESGRAVSFEILEAGTQKVMARGHRTK